MLLQFLVDVRDQRLDSPLEESGFEPLVPLLRMGLLGVAEPE